MPHRASPPTLALSACLLCGCANVHLTGPDNQRAIAQAQRESIEWQKTGVPERAADANARAHQLQQRVDRDEVSFTEFALSVLMDELLGGWRDAPGKHWPKPTSTRHADWSA